MPAPWTAAQDAIASDGQPAAVWRRDQEILLVESTTSQEQKLGRGVQPWLAANDQGLYAVWLGIVPAISISWPQVTTGPQSWPARRRSSCRRHIDKPRHRRLGDRRSRTFFNQGDDNSSLG